MRWFPFPTLALSLVAPMLSVLTLLTPAHTASAQPKLSEEQLRELVEQLGSDHYTVRRRAERRLTHAGRPAVPLLIDALATSHDAEVTFRVQSILTGIGEDFLVLCAHLSDRNPRVRRYAEESLAIRLLDNATPAVAPPQPNRPEGVQQEEMLHGEVQFVEVDNPRRRQPLRAQRMAPGEYTGPAWTFLHRVIEPYVVVVVMPSAWDHPGLFAEVSLTPAETNMVQGALDSVCQQTGLTFSEGVFAGLPAAVISSPRPGARRTDSERDVVLGVCATVWYDLPEARAEALRKLGLYYARRAPVREMLVRSVQQEANPIHDELVRALMLSGRPMSDCLPAVPEAAVQTVVRAVRDESADWLTRQAAIRALLTWYPAEPPPGPTTGPRAARHRARVEAYQASRAAWYERVLPVLEQSLQPDQSPVVRYLALWAVGALRGLWPDAASGTRIVEAVAAALHDDHGDISRQALLSLGWLAPDPPPAGAVDRALELGFRATDEALRQAALEFLRTARNERLFATVLARYRELLDPGEPGDGDGEGEGDDSGEGDDADADNDEPMSPAQARKLRLFLATLLAEATDADTLRGILTLLPQESDDEVMTTLVRAFDEDVKDPSLWDALLDLLRHDDRAVRHAGKRIVLRTNLPDREAHIRDLLQAATAADRRVELQIMLFRLGDESLLEVLVNAFRSDDEALAMEAATGLGETMSDEALSIFREAFGAELVTTRLAAVQGLDAFGRACAESGNVEKVREGYQLLFNFGRDESDAVRNLARDVRTRYSGTNGYRAMADRMRNAARAPDEPVRSYPLLPPEPAALFAALEADGAESGTDPTED